MSHQDDKEKHSKRMLKELNAIHKQMKIAKSHGVEVNQYEGHRYAKHHALDCGNPGCPTCGNPRKLYKEETIQEKRFKQSKIELE
jgi:hypothetical protein